MDFYLQTSFPCRMFSAHIVDIIEYYIYILCILYIACLVIFRIIDDTAIPLMDASLIRLAVIAQSSRFCSGWLGFIKHFSTFRGVIVSSETAISGIKFIQCNCNISGSHCCICKSSLSKT
jgi:hypothetical protein